MRQATAINLHKVVIAVVALVLCATGAMAQTCPPYGVTDAYREAAQSGTPHAIVRGTLRLDPALWPRGRNGRISAELEGVALGPLGAREVFRQDLVLQVTCDDGICPAPFHGDVLAFVQRDGNAFTLRTGLCRRSVFHRPIAQAVRYVQNCLDQKPCPSGADILRRLVENGDVVPLAPGQQVD